MPHLQEVWEKNHSKGLRVFAVEGDGFTALENYAFAGENKYTFPLVTLADSQLSSWDCKTMPNTFVINADGKLVFSASEGWDEVVTKELAKRVYPGLKRDKVEKECEKAAQAYGKGEYAKALELAKAVIDAAPGEKAQADAQFISDAAQALSTSLRSTADAAKAEKRFEDCLVALDRLALGFKGTPEGDAAGEEAKELRKDKDAKREISAWQALAKALESNKKAKGKIEKAKALRAVQKANEGTAAGAKAREVASAIEGSKMYR